MSDLEIAYPSPNPQRWVIQWAEVGGELRRGEYPEVYWIEDRAHLDARVYSMCLLGYNFAVVPLLVKENE